MHINLSVVLDKAISPYPTVVKVYIVKYIEIVYNSPTDSSPKLFNSIHESLSTFSSSEVLPTYIHMQLIRWQTKRRVRKKNINLSNPCPNLITELTLFSIFFLCFTTFIKRIRRVIFTSLYNLLTRVILTI